MITIWRTKEIDSPTNISVHFIQLSLRRIECKFEEQPHLSVDLNRISEALAAHSTIAIPIVFRPLKETKYHECLMFTINSTNEKKITITGEGISYKVSKLSATQCRAIGLLKLPCGDKGAVRWVFLGRPGSGCYTGVDEGVTKQVSRC